VEGESFEMTGEKEKVAGRKEKKLFGLNVNLITLRSI